MHIYSIQSPYKSSSTFMALRQKLAQVTDEERSIKIEVDNKIPCVSSTKVLLSFHFCL